MCKILLLLIILISTLSANRSNAQSLSLKDCIEIALLNNSQLRIAQYQKELAKQNVLNSFAQILPNINLSGSATQDKWGATNYIGSTRIIETLPGGERERYNVNVTLNQNIFDGGRWWNSIYQAKINDRSQLFYLKDQINSTVELVQQEYYELLKEKKLLEVYQLATKRSRSQLERAQRMFELGLVSKIDVARARVNLGADSISALTQEVSVETAKKNLNLSMGREPIEPISILEEFKLEYSLSPIDSLLGICFTNNPYLQAIECDEKRAAIGVKLAYGNLWPSIGGFITYKRTVPELNAVYSNFNQEYNFIYGISIGFNIFNGFRDYVRIQRAKLNNKSARELYIETKRNLKSAVRQLYDTYATYLKVIKINEMNLEASKEEFNLAEERYQLGSGTALEVREAQLNLTTAEQTLVAAHYNARITLAQLERQLGTIY